MPPVLVLFDLDRTLMIAGRTPVNTMEQAGRVVWGESFTTEGVDRAGNLDSLIVAEACQLCGLAFCQDTHDAFANAYVTLLSQTTFEPELLPHAKTLLADLAQPMWSHVVVGMVTGNYEGAARLKLKAAGIDDRQFIANGFAGEADTRPQLVAHAIKQAEALIGQPIPAERVLVVGDTPHDVNAALANGCRVWAVTTGRHTAEDLKDAHLATDHLPDTGFELMTALSLAV